MSNSELVTWVVFYLIMGILPIRLTYIHIDMHKKVNGLHLLMFLLFFPTTMLVILMEGIAFALGFEFEK